MRSASDAAFGLDPLRGLPHGILDDAQLWRGGCAPQLDGVGAGNAPAGRRILDHPNLVPDDAAGVELVEQHAVSAGVVAVDRRCVPVLAARWCNSISVQRRSDRTRRVAGDEAIEDAAHCRRLGLMDGEMTRLPRHRPIAIGAAAGVTAVPHHGLEAAADMQRQIFQIHFAHQGTQRAIEAADIASGGVNLDPEKIEPLSCGVIVGLIARYAIDILGDDDVEQLGLSGRHQRGKARPVLHRSAARRAIFKRHDDSHALAGADLAAKRDLIVDGFVVLQVGRKASVDGCADHGPWTAARAWLRAISAS